MQLAFQSYSWFHFASSLAAALQQWAVLLFLFQSYYFNGFLMTFKKCIFWGGQLQKNAVKFIFWCNYFCRMLFALFNDFLMSLLKHNFLLKSLLLSLELKSLKAKRNCFNWSVNTISRSFAFVSLDQNCFNCWFLLPQTNFSPRFRIIVSNLTFLWQTWHKLHSIN